MPQKHNTYTYNFIFFSIILSYLFTYISTLYSLSRYQRTSIERISNLPANFKIIFKFPNIQKKKRYKTIEPFSRLKFK